MGVRGLKTFLDREGKTRTVNIIEEISQWQSKNPEQTPIIVVDFCSLKKDNKKKEDNICGGAGEITTNKWNQILNKIKEAGCSLVFFSDPRFKEKEAKLVEQMNELFSFYVDLYNRIDDRQTLKEISDEWMENFNETITYRELAVIARRYGEYRYSINEECDLELAQYATQHNAMAVISNDTDFLIYEGSWQLWWNGDNIDMWNQLKTTEYIRKDLEKWFSLSGNQLPLFATLLGSHFTKNYRNRFFGRQRLDDVASYVRRVGRGPYSDLDVKRITNWVYKDETESVNEIQKSIRGSLEWFDIRTPPPRLKDELAETFLDIGINGVDMFRAYMRLMRNIHVIPTQYYDFRGCKTEMNLPLLQMDWIKRKAGILTLRFHDDAFELTIWAKTEISMTANIKHVEKPSFPDFEVPPLKDLYVENETDDTEITSGKWRILSWIMDQSGGLPPDVISTIQKLPSHYVLISTILYALVQNGLVSVMEADGILYTEHKAMDYESEIKDVKYPTTLESRHVRAAHIYRSVFESVKENFAIAGLLSIVGNRYLNFHGVYYQNVMARLQQMDSAERDTFIAPIENFRIYSAKSD